MSFEEQKPNNAYETIAKSKCDVIYYNQKLIIQKHNPYGSVSLKQKSLNRRTTFTPNKF
jgi:hypothetical protein